MTHTDEKIDLVINQMTQSQYDQAKADGELNANELYVTETLPPSKTSDLVNDSGFITASAIPSNVGAFTNDVGYVTASSSEFTNKRDYNDLTYPASIYPSGTYRIYSFDLVVDGMSPSEYQLARFSSSNDNSRWSDEDNYWTFAVVTSNGTNFSLEYMLPGAQVASFTMSEINQGEIVRAIEVGGVERNCSINVEWRNTTLALKDYVDAAIASNIGQVLNESF